MTMIEELKEHIYGYDQQGKPAVAGPPTLEEVVDKVNEIIRYLNEREGDHFRESTKMIDEPVTILHGLEEEAQSWAGSSAVDAFKAGVEWLKKQFTWRDIANICVYLSDVDCDFRQAGLRLGDDTFYKEVLKRFVESKKGLFRPCWAPTEEQFEALNRCAVYLEESDSEDAEIIKSLFIQLKQL